MKTILRLPLLMFFLISGLLTNAQEIQKISEEAPASWKEQLEKLSEITQTPLKQDQFVVEATATPQNYEATKIGSFNDLIKKSTGAAKSAEYSKLNWQNQLAKIDEAKKRRSIQSSGQPQFKLSDGNVSKENELIEQDNFYENMKLAIHERNVRQQQEIIRRGGNLKSKSVVMGSKTGLKLDEEGIKKMKEQASNELENSLTKLSPKESKRNYNSKLQSKTAAERFKIELGESFVNNQRTIGSLAPAVVPATTTYDTITVDDFPTIDITDNGEGIGTVTFTTDYVYRLVGLCFVNEGQTLTINPGTIVKGYRYQAPPSMLIVAKGGTLVAQGTADAPIIFTSESDQLLPPAGPNNLKANLSEWDSGLWGGIAIMGDGLVNNNVGEIQMLGSGIDLPTDSRLEFGGDDSQSNTGTIIEYVSIRHTGESVPNISPTATYFESFESGIDSWTFFNSTYAPATFNQSFSLATDGAASLEVSVENPQQITNSVFSPEVLVGSWKIEPIAGALGVGPSLGDLSWWSNSEQDISTRSCFFDDVWTFDELGNVTLDLQGETWLEPFQGVAFEQCGIPVFPHDGSGSYTYDISGNDITLSGQGIYLGLPKVYNGGELDGTNEEPQSITYTVSEFTEIDGTERRLTLNIETNSGTFWSFKLINTTQSAPQLNEAFLAGNWKMEPVEGAFGVGPNQGDISWYANTANDISTRSCFFDDVYTFDESGNFSIDLQGETWLETWQAGFEGCGTPVYPHDGNGFFNYTLNGTELTVNGFGAYLGLPKTVNGAELSDPLTAPETTTYTITNFSESNGVKYMTLDINVGTAWWRYRLIGGDSDVQLPEANFAGIAIEPFTDYVLSVDVSGSDWSVANMIIEGFNGETLYNETINFWSGSSTVEAWFNSGDNSEVKLISIFPRPELPGQVNTYYLDNIQVKSVNGSYGGQSALMLAGVDNGAIIDHIEMIGVADDGVECLGGYVDMSHVIVNLSGDDAFDVDLGYTGKMQFLLGMGSTGNIGEFDGGDPAGEVDGGPSIYNATFIGTGSFDTDGIRFRDNASGFSYNSIIQDFSTGVQIEYTDLEPSSSWDKVLSGNLNIKNNVFWNINTGDFLSVADNSELGDFSGDVYSQLSLQTNLYQDPGLDENFVPSNTISGEFTFFNAGDEFFASTNYPGAFEPGVAPWHQGWSLINYSPDPRSLVNGSDYDALLAIRDALGGSLNDWWQESISPLDWPNVNFDQNGRVFQLDLVNAGLNGDMPLALNDLTELIWMNLGDNNITSLPEGISALNKLEGISMYNNNLQSLPSDFFGLAPSLTLLDLGGSNALGGNTLPAGFGSLVNLEYLYLWGMNLTGLPDEISNLKSLKLLNLDGNPIEVLPESFGGLESLEELYMSNNNSLQTLPTSFVELDMLRGIWMYNNTNNSSDVSVFFGLDSLRTLDVYSNNLTGTLDGIEASPKLEYVYFGANQISGGIPSSISALTNLLEFRVHDNLLDQPLTPELFELPNLYQIELYGNSIPGEFPNTAGSSSVASIALGGNELESLSDGIGNFPNMNYLDLNDNNLSGRLPVALASDTSLNTINLQYNNFTGNIPVEWTSSLSNLSYLYLSDNLLDEPIPAEIGNLTNLVNLAIDQNNIPGELPESFNSLQYIGELYIWGNELTGLPDLSGLTNMYAFYAFDNYLEFDDFESLMQLNVIYSENFGISPQLEPEPEIQYLAEGTTEIAIDATVGGSSNHYNWYFNGNYIEGIDTAVFVIPELTLETAGTYWCEISNDSVTNNSGLYLSSGERMLWINAPISENDSLALVDIYEATKGEEWNNSFNWLMAPVVMWEGVILDNGRVVKLDLYEKNMQSGLPPAIGDLDALTWLSLYNNPNMGYVPGEFYGLTNLTYLDLDNTGLKRLSPGIKEMTALDTLWLGSNPYENKLPAELFDLTGLLTLGIHNTPFEGQLPSEIGQLVNLKQLWLNNNPGVVGDIPSSFEKLTQLEFLNLANSGFTGGLEHVGALTSLKQLYIYSVPAAHNELPDNFANLTNMERFGLGFADYDLRGFPNEIFSMTKLKVLQLPASNINKDIPEGFANLDSLQFLNLRDNGLGVTSFGFGSSVFFPEGMNTDSLRSVYIQNNNFDDISIFLNSDSLTNFYANGNKLDFEDLLPFEEYMNTHENYTQYNFSNMQSLERQYVQLSPGESIRFDPPLDYDDFTFVDYYKDEEFLLSLTRDTFIGLLQSVTLENVTNPDYDGNYDGYLYHEIISPLTDLTLHHDSRNIQVVESILESDSLALIQFRDHFIADNPYHFEGWALEEGDDIPVENWPGVIAYGGKVLGIAMNGLTGTLPTGVFNQFDSLVNIYMTDGQLTGSIPADVFTSEIQSIDFGRNMLTGSIPEISIQDGALEFLGLAGNQLSGEIPASLANFPQLSQLYLDNNRLTGAIPSSFTGLNFGGFSVDRNRLTDIPADFFIALEGGSYSNFEYNQFGPDDLIFGLGNFVSTDYSYAPQGESRMLTWTGDANVGGMVTLHAERLHESDQFYWFRQNKYSPSPYYDQIGSTGTDSSFTVQINGDYDQANYMAVVLNAEYKYGSYPFYSEQVPVDPYEKRFASSQTSSPFENPNDYGADLNGAVGYPDVPPTFSSYEFEGRNELDWWRYDGWWKNPKEPELDTLELGYDNPIQVNYMRLHSPASELQLNSVVLMGSGGEEASLNIRSTIFNDANQITFPRTTFAVSSVKLILTGGSIDAFEIGDTGNDELKIPQLSDNFTNVGKDFIYVHIEYDGIADYLVVERSEDGEVFEEIDVIGYTGWYYDQVVPGKYFYRVKAVFEGLGVETEYSEVLATGNCEPSYLIPDGKVWSGFSYTIDGNYPGKEGSNDSIYVSLTGSYGEYYVSDLTAGWYNWAGYSDQQGILIEKCDNITGYAEASFNITPDASFENDTLYIEWWDNGNGIHALSKLWVIGDQEEEEYDLERPFGLTAELQSKNAISLTWEDDNPDNTSYIIQASVDVASNFQDIDVVTGTKYYQAPNTLDGQYRYYRVIASYNMESTFPSNEVSIIHKAPLFDQVENEVSLDINRSSYGGSWGDFDADGDDDLYVSNALDNARNFLYENTGNGTFRKVVGTLATSEDRFTRSATWGDYNNDGFVDLYSPGLTRADGQTVGFDKIYQNTGSRSFVTANENVMSTTAHPYSPSETGVWVDLNNDGWLDLVKSTGYVLMNDGTGQLTVGNELELPQGPLSTLGIYFWAVSNIDLENDGDQDIYITSDSQNMLFINDGAGNMTYYENEISNANLASRGYSWADFDNDGLMDLLTGEGDMNQFGIYKNMGNLEFYFVSQGSDDSGNSGFTAGRGYTVADFNNDGMVDILLNVDGRATIAVNRGFFNFEPISIEDQAFPMMNLFSHVAVADVNQDGFVDVFLPNQDEEGSNFVYLNNANSNSWITVQLKGIKSNKSGIGARVTVESNLNEVFTQQIISQNGLGSGNSLAAEFGLGSATSVNKITVYWPSGDTTFAESVAVNQVFTMVEVVEEEGGGPTVNESDSTILYTLYEELGGQNWLNNQGWGEGSPLAWEGTFWSTPDPETENLPRLISLVLNENNLTDTIPAEIGGLTELQILDLSQNNLSGNIPVSIGNLTKLVNLSLNNNQITGKIPASIGSLANLENLDLFNNNMFGELPRTLGGLVNLKQFEIQNNAFIGFVPAVIGTLSNLQILRMDHNQFEGVLPAGLGAMESLSVLYLNDNQFTGELPEDLGDLSNLSELRIFNNEFFGTIPATFSKLQRMEYLDISNNDFVGSLSPFNTLSSMYYFNASQNRFTSIGDFSQIPSDTVIVTNNWLDFGDFDENELLIIRNVLGYNPQDSLFEAKDTLHAVAVPIDFGFAIGGSGNVYTWKLNGEPIESDANVSIEGSSVSIIRPDSPNQGEYILEITNDRYPDVTLVTRPYTLKLTSLERDRQALLAFKNAVANTYDLSSWDGDLSDSWVGVTLSDDENNIRVIGLELPGTEGSVLKGTVPSSFADLSGIETLNLSSNELSSFPNISKWPSLTSVDLRRNRLKFASLIPNVKLGDKIQYDPQRRLGTTLFDTLVAGEDPILFVENQGFGSKYQWQFGPFIPGEFYNNDVEPIDEANSRVYQIQDLDYDQMGTYRVKVTHDEVPGLELESRNQNIMAATTLFGTVYAVDDTNPVTSGEVITFRKTPVGPFVPEDTVQISTSAEFQFDNVVLGDFLLLTKPDRDVYPITTDPGSTVIVDSYYDTATLYEDAKTLEVRQKSSGLDIFMSYYQIPLPQPTGADFNGLVESDIEQDSLVDEEARILARKKVKRAACSMRRYTGSGRLLEDDSVFVLYAYVESDDDGNFKFEGIEDGIYKLNIQYPGVPMDPDSDITFVVGGDKENQEFEITAVITENGIEVERREVLYTLKPYIKDVMLYPNPTEGKLKADFLVYRRINDLKLEVTDVRGVKLFEQELSPRMGMQSAYVDLTNFESGVYFMVFTDSQGTFKHQVKVSRK